MTEAEKLARLFGVLSSDTRIKIIRMLKGHPLCVGAISRRLGITQAAVSQHLRLLRDAGLVEPEKRGYFVHYRLNGKALEKWKKAAQRLLDVTSVSCDAACRSAGKERRERRSG